MTSTGSFTNGALAPRAYSINISKTSAMPKIDKIAHRKKPETEPEPEKLEEYYYQIFEYQHFSYTLFVSNENFKKKMKEDKENYLNTLTSYKEKKFNNEDVDLNIKEYTKGSFKNNYNANKKELPRNNPRDIKTNFRPGRGGKSVLGPVLPPINNLKTNQHIPQNKAEGAQKKFICTGGYPDIVNGMISRGWVMNQDSMSTDFDFIWTLKVAEIQFGRLRKDQIAAHFKKNGAITRKSGLCKNIKNCYFKGINPNNFFPRCYDLKFKEEEKNFLEDFKFNKAVSILKQCHKIINSDSELPLPALTKEIIETVLKIVSRKMFLFTKNYTKNNKKKNILISSKEWDIISGEKEKKPINTRKVLQNYSITNKIPKKKGPTCMQNIFESNNKLLEKKKELETKAKPKKEKKESPNIKTKADLEEYKSKINSFITQLMKHQTQYYLNGDKNIWIVKPSGLSRGRGISCINKLEEYEIQKSENPEIIVQKYIENPLIILGRKFDIRQWVLVTSLNPLTVWLWERPYLRFGAEDYDINNIGNLYAHLTNNSIGKHSENFKNTKIEGNMWEIEDFKSFLKSKYEVVWERIREKIINIILCSLDSARHEIFQRENSIELFGFDLMIDEDLNVFLIEINSSPAMDYSTKVTEHLVKEMLSDLLKIVIDHKDDKNKLERVGGYTKVYCGQEINEQYLPNKPQAPRKTPSEHTS